MITRDCFVSARQSPRNYNTVRNNRGVEVLSEANILSFDLYEALYIHSQTILKLNTQKLKPPKVCMADG